MIHRLILHEGPDGFAGGTVHSRPGGFAQPDPFAQSDGLAEPGGFAESGVVLVPRGDRAAVYESAIVESGAAFTALLPSWNLSVPPGCGVRVELRVRDAARGTWSPWLEVGDWGEACSSAPAEAVAFDGGTVEVDYLRCTRPQDAARYRVTAHCSGEAAGHRMPPVAQGGDFCDEGQTGLQRFITIHRMGLCFSGGADGCKPGAAGAPPEPAAPHTRAASDGAGPTAAVECIALAVPFLSQRVLPAALAERACSPTSVAMVLRYHGVQVTAEQVAQRAYDARHDLYGNWPRNVQAAFSFGVAGCVTRFSHWKDVQAALTRCGPIILSIRAAPGELRGAPLEQTSGHLLVLTGFDGRGGARVNDPAGATATAGCTTYALEDLEKVWFARGGTAYLLGLPESALPPG